LRSVSTGFQHDVSALVMDVLNPARLFAPVTFTITVSRHWYAENPISHGTTSMHTGVGCEITTGGWHTTTGGSHTTTRGRSTYTGRGAITTWVRMGSKRKKIPARK